MRASQVGQTCLKHSVQKGRRCNLIASISKRGILLYFQTVNDGVLPIIAKGIGPTNNSLDERDVY